MAKTTKTAGYDIIIRAFVPADPLDPKLYQELQGIVQVAKANVANAGGDGKFELIPTRR